MPNSLKSIALHVGPHKTASTHLQQMLEANQQLLSKDGVRFLGPRFLRRRGCSLSAMFNMSWSASTKPRRKPLDQLDFLAKGHSRLVFSEENFAGRMTEEGGRVPFPLYPTLPEKLEELIAAWAPFKPHIFLAVRSPAPFMTSVYSQTLSGAPDVGPRSFRAQNDWRKIDWPDLVTRIRAVPGVGDVIVWRQEDYATTPRPVLRRLLGWRTGGKVEICDERVHQGLSAPAVRLTLQRGMEGETGRISSEARKAFPINEKNNPFSLYAASTTTSANAIYAQQVAQIAAMDGVKMLYRPKVNDDGANKG